MKSRNDLSAYIRYQLSQLGAFNKAHEFELLAYELARLRICSNLIRATGPVQAGGDQGRDFETFHTFITHSSIASSAFVGAASDKTIFFACSLEKRVPKKIRDDLKVIFGGDVKPYAVYFFCEANLPVAQRHRLQSECKKQHDVPLEIIDGQSIADFLAEPDTFWIAEEYLDVPGDFFPVAADRDESYESLKERWIKSDREIQNLADFIEVKRGLRRATFDLKARPDLTAWMKKIRYVLRPSFGQRLHRKAQYELSVAQLRGRGNLDPEADTVRAYFDGVTPECAPTEFMDAVILFTYCVGAVRRKHFQASNTDLDFWQGRITGVLDSVLRSSVGKIDRCVLLEARSYLHQVAWLRSEQTEQELEELFVWWDRLLDVAEQTPLYLAERFVDRLNGLASLFGEKARYRKIVDRADKIIRERSGAHGVAEKARDRAMEYLRSDKILPAINELQRAKVNWFTGETLKGSILSILILSDCYSRLGLFFAARYYAAGALFLAVRTDEEPVKDLIGKAALAVFETFYEAGEGLTSIHVLSDSLMAHDITATDPDDWKKHGDVARAVTYWAIFRAMVLRFAPSLLPHVDAQLALIRLSDEERKEIAAMAEGEPWSSMSDRTILQRMQEDLGGHLFQDIGMERSATWNALGIKWEVRFHNDPTLLPSAEEFVALLQIIHADFADLDLGIIPSEALIEIVLGDKIEVTSIPDNERVRCRVVLRALPKSFEKMTRDEERERMPFSVAMAILSEVTTFSFDTFKPLLEERLERGLISRAFSVRPAIELMHFVRPEKMREVGFLDGLSKPAFDFQFSPKEYEELKWSAGPGPGYSKARAEEFISNRYLRSLPPIKITFPLLLKNPRTRKILEAMRSKGYLDWQILLLIMNLVINYRLNQMRDAGVVRLDEIKKIMNQLSTRDESPLDIPYDLDEFNEEAIEHQENFTMASAFKVWGLEIHRSTPDFRAMRRLLDERYGHSSDDIPHKDIFLLSPGESPLEK